MKAPLFELLIHRYAARADYHGCEAILGPKKYRAYHEREEKKYVRLIIEIGEKYLHEYNT